MLGSQYLSGAALTNANMIGGRYGGYGNVLQDLRYQQPTGAVQRNIPYSVQAGMVDAKSKSMGVTSPVRYGVARGSKYGFGL
jgi:hypothetical protein